jgi:hypothetical protein
MTTLQLYVQRGRFNTGKDVSPIRGGAMEERGAKVRYPLLTFFHK